MKKLILALSAALACDVTGNALASYADDRAEIENLSNRYMVAVDAGDIETVMTTWAEDGVLEWVRGTEVGKAAIRKALADRFKQIPDMRWEGQEYILAGDQAVSLWMVRGRGSDGEELNYQGCDIYRLEGDKIIDKNTFWKIVEHKDRL